MYITDTWFCDYSAGSDPESLRWNVQAELVHCRWAMLGAAGIFIPEFLTKIGILNTPFWYTAGEQQYFTDTTTLFIIELILIGWAEGRRWADIIKPGSVNTDPIFPSNKLTGTDVGYYPSRSMNETIKKTYPKTYLATGGPYING